MCGRFTTQADPQALAALFGASFQAEGLHASYNVAPLQKVPVVLLEDGARVLRAFQWGLVPSWAKEASIGNRLINARGETLPEKPAFRQAFRRRRCLILSDGFFEWKTGPARKTPHFIRVAGREVFAFAGIWERWAPPEGEPLFSCAIVTTAANAFMAPIHARMPVILPAEAEDLWLDPAAGEDALRALLVPYAGEMAAHPVSTLVNSPRNNLPECVLPFRDPLEGAT